jgi:hypothetical protein
MLGTHKLIVDEWAEVWDLLKPYADASFWQWPDTFDPTARYIVGRVVLKDNWQQITDLATQYPGRIIFSNPAEGSETVLLQLRRLRITEHVRDGRIGLLTSGDMEPGWDYCRTDAYFTNIVEYTENQHAATLGVLQQKNQRPYDFLFLNGRLRPHRKYLIDEFRARGLLDRALWTNLSSQVELGFTSQLTNRLSSTYEPVRLLLPKYEIERAVPQMDLVPESGFVKHLLFNNTWGDAIVNPYCYTDTWFSVVTETIFDYPHSFRTEKIWKPILMGHPFIVAANPGYYRDLRNAGFRTFHSLIDESFDQIDRPEDRIERIIQGVYRVCAFGADKFWMAAQDICKYNRERLTEYNREQRSQLPDNLKKYLDARS